MPFCKICRGRIDVSKTGVIAYKCRQCGKICCKTHFLTDKGICVVCAGIKLDHLPKGPNFGSFTRTPPKKKS